MRKKKAKLKVKPKPEAKGKVNPKHEIVDVLTIHGHTVLIVEDEDTIDWYVQHASEDIDEMVTAYLVAEGFLEKWFGKEAVQEAIGSDDDEGSQAQD